MVDDAVAELSLAMGYERQNATTCVQAENILRLNLCCRDVHEGRRPANTNTENPGRPEGHSKSHTHRPDLAQLTAEATGAFREDDAKRKSFPFELLWSLALAILLALSPRFYKIEFTNGLDRCGALGKYPSAPTDIYRHSPSPGPRRQDDTS